MVVLEEWKGIQEICSLDLCLEGLRKIGENEQSSRQCEALSDERRAAQTRIVAFTTPLKSMAPAPDMNPASGIFSKMNCGSGEAMFAMIILRIKATSAPVH
jgi:hypothetical protein